MPLQSKYIKILEFLISVAWLWQSIETEYLYQVCINLKTKIHSVVCSWCNKRLIEIDSCGLKCNLGYLNWIQIIEHVADPEEFCKSLAALAKKDGLVFVSTLNRSLPSFGLAIVAAEYILGWVSSLFLHISVNITRKFSFVSCYNVRVNIYQKSLDRTLWGTTFPLFVTIKTSKHVNSFWLPPGDWLLIRLSMD